MPFSSSCARQCGKRRFQPRRASILSVMPLWAGNDRMAASHGPMHSPARHPSGPVARTSISLSVLPNVRTCARSAIRQMQAAPSASHCSTCGQLCPQRSIASFRSLRAASVSGTGQTSIVRSRTRPCHRIAATGFATAPSAPCSPPHQWFRIRSHRP